jgi:hypothetical protein
MCEQVMVEITYDKKLMDHDTAEKVVAALDRFSYTGAIKQFREVPGPASCAVLVSANKGQDYNFLSTVLESMEVDWRTRNWEL